jgi:hypothetical protein
MRDYEAKVVSTNNLDSDAVVKGYGGTPVPAYGVQIIGVGKNGGREVLYEVILIRPGITHAAASSGDLTLSGRNEAASLETLSQLAAMTASGSVSTDAVKEDLHQTTVASSKVKGDPLVLRGDLKLFGDAISAGGIKQEGNIQFLHGGLPQAHSRKVEIPEISDITAYNPDGLDGVTELDPSYSGSNPFQSRNLRNGDLVIDGDIDLNGALIYATGNITINGTVTGEGGIISEKNVTISGHSALKADSKVAVIAGGDLTLTGTGAERSMFSGLIYGQGAVRASNVTVVGGLVANNVADPDKAGMTVTDAKLINLPEKTKFDVRGEVEKDDDSPQGGLFEDSLGDKSVTLIPPSLDTLLEDDGTWNGNPVSFKYEKGGVVYESLDQVPGLGGALADLQIGEYRHQGEWEDWLKDQKPITNDQEVIFQLDPNQLLTVSGGYKIVLRRPLDG